MQNSYSELFPQNPQSRCTWKVTQIGWLCIDMDLEFEFCFAIHRRHSTHVKVNLTANHFDLESLNSVCSAVS